MVRTPWWASRKWARSFLYLSRVSLRVCTASSHPLVHVDTAGQEGAPLIPPVPAQAVQSRPLRTQVQHRRLLPGIHRFSSSDTAVSGARASGPSIWASSSESDYAGQGAVPGGHSIAPPASLEVVAERYGTYVACKITSLWVTGRALVSPLRMADTTVPDSMPGTVALTSPCARAARGSWPPPGRGGWRGSPCGSPRAGPRRSGPRRSAGCGRRPGTTSSARAP